MFILFKVPLQHLHRARFVRSSVFILNHCFIRRTKAVTYRNFVAHGSKCIEEKLLCVAKKLMLSEKAVSKFWVLFS